MLIRASREGIKSSRAPGQTLVGKEELIDEGVKIRQNLLKIQKRFKADDCLGDKVARTDAILLRLIGSKACYASILPASSWEAKALQFLQYDK